MRGDQGTQVAVLLLAMAAVIGFTGWKLVDRQQAGPYGAIAMSDSSLAYGGAWGYSDPVSAYKRAVRECNSAAKDNDCVVKVSLKDNCGALAISAEHNASYLVQGRDQVVATGTALAQCRATGAGDCAIHENICSSES